MINFKQLRSYWLDASQVSKLFCLITVAWMRLNYPTTSAIYFSRIYTSTSTSSDYSIRASNATTARGSVHSLLKSDKKDDLGLISVSLMVFNSLVYMLISDNNVY